MYKYKAKLVRVVDGDTVILKIDLGFQIHVDKRIRLARIDAIERKDDPTRAATYAVEEWFRGTGDEVFVTTYLDKTDVYGRVIGELTQTFLSKDNMGDGVTLSEHMVKLGYAVYKDYGVK